MKEFHNNSNFHVFEGETVVDFDDVLVAQGLEDLALNEYGVDVTYWADVLCFDGFNGEFLSGQFVDGKVYFPEPSLT